jgi:hypothetical protein
MFSRADAWVNWKQGRSNDRPSMAPFIVAAHGVRGVIQILSGTRAAKQRREAEKSPAPNPAMAGS